MRRRIGIHQRGSHLRLADIVDELNNFLADVIQRRSNIFAHLGGNGNRALDADNVVAGFIVGKEVDKADRGIFHVAVGAHAPEHGGFKVSSRSGGVVAVGNHDHADILTCGIAVRLQLVGVLIAAPGIRYHGIKGGGSSLFADHQAPAFFLRLYGQLPHIHDILWIVKAQRGGIFVVKVQAIVAHDKAQVIGRAARHERVAQAGGLVDFLGNLDILGHCGIHRQAQAQLIQNVLAIQHNRRIRTSRDRVDFAVHCAGVQNILLYVAHIQAAVGNIAAQIGGNAVFYIFRQLGVVHLEHVGRLTACNLSGKLGPVAVPVGVVHDHVDVGIQLLKFFQHLSRHLMARLRTPPQNVQGGLAFGAGCGVGAGAGTGSGL